MDRWVGKVAVVTGASSGIGAAIVKDLVKAGLIVIGLARRVENVEAMKGDLSSEKGKLYGYYCDVSDLSSIKEAFAWIEENFKVVNILVNNAGIARNGYLLGDEDNMADMKSVIDTNLSGLVCCTQTAFRIMKKHNADGHIVNINSIAGHFPLRIPNSKFNIYPATKYGVTSVTDVVRQELTELGNKKVRVSSISPGLVRTEIIGAGNFDEEKLFTEFPTLNSEDISAGLLYVLGAPPHVQVHELIIKPVGEPF